MAIYLMCLTSIGGLPIFTRKRGDCDNLPFSTVASLNGVHIFFKSLGMSLQTTFTEDWTLFWKDFHNSITIILCGKALTEQQLSQIADLVFHSFGLFISNSDFAQPSILDRMKREAKNYVPIVDRILESCDSDIFGFNDCVLTSQNTQILLRLNEFSSQCGSLFCSFVINQKLAVGTEGWWDLHIIDRKLLIILQNTSNNIQKDVPIYLPKKSPNIAYRFITIPITSDGVLCVLCGAEPPQNEVNLMAQSIFKNDIELVQNAERSMPRNFPDNIDFDTNILGILLLNKFTRKCVLSRNLHQSLSGKRSISGSHRFDILRTFFDHAIDAIEEFIGSSVDKKITYSISSVGQYWCSEYHKCYALSYDDGNMICVLFVASVPTHTMKLITQKTLSSTLQEKSICW